jgi:hypothetical protein
VQEPGSDAERREVQITGLDPERYSTVRRAGATHDEAMEAHVLGADLPTYVYALRSRRDHREALNEAGASNSPARLEAGRLGVSRRELDEVLASCRADVDAYWRALGRAAPGEADAPSQPYARLSDYLLARGVGLAHADSLWLMMVVRHLGERPASRDVQMWARCMAAGLDRSLVFASAGRGRGVMKGTQVTCLHALLFVSRTIDPAPAGIMELIEVARRAASRRIDAHAYLAARAQGMSPRTAMRRASTSWADQPAAARVSRDGRGRDR